MNHSKIEICHVISSIDIETGGPARSSTGLVNAVLDNSMAYNVSLVTKQSENPIIKKFNSDKGKIIFNKENIVIPPSNLYHGHGIWELPIHSMALKARNINVPYVISIRGMLESWALNQGKFKKKLALFLYQRKDLKKAVCIHATASSELKSIRALNIKTPVAVIPNGINVEEFEPDIPKKSKNRKQILFLSRIHKKKGIEFLINAWAKLPNSIKKGWEICIIGNGEQGYIDSLKRMVIEKKLDDDVFIKPPVFGRDKVETFRNASLFVLPTYSENFGIVIAEALASYTPVITTVGTPWYYLLKRNCGDWINLGVDPLVESLKTMMTKNDEELLIMGKNGRSLIESKYAIDAIGKNMVKLYDWILNENIEKPEFVDVV